MRRIAAAYLHEQDWATAIAAERKWAEVAPHDVMPYAALGYALMSMEQYSEAAAAYQQAILFSKTPDMLKVRLGRAQLRSGSTEMGKVTLEALVTKSQDAAVLNGAAYELGDAGLDLSAAEAAAHKAVAMVSDRTAAARLESATDSDLREMSLLAQSWDTLGWIFFKEHRLAEAENYVRCAWLLGNHDEVGLHLGQIYEAEGKKNEAIATYRMAAGLIASPHPWPYYVHMREGLLAKIAALQNGPAATPAGADSSATVELRTYTIPNPMHGVPATAELLLHMTETRVDGVRLLRGDAALMAAESSLEAMKYNAAVPTITRARILRRATLSCMPGASTCTLRLRGIFSARIGE